MRVINIQPHTNNRITFGTIVVPEEDVRSNILHKLNEKQLKKLKVDLIHQQSNPVNAVIYKNNKHLTAKLYCQYRLKNFKDKYTQYPIFESNINFVKRILKICSDYKKQLKL